MDLSEATETARRVRGLYHQIEERVEGSPWSIKDDMLGLVNDVGTLSRLIMATEGRWAPEGDPPTLLEGKIAECLWWVLDLAARLDIDIEAAYAKTMAGIENGLEGSISRLDP
jgi:NTP pyrophosphatase (non-canonical NTP hydrolase)